MTLTFKSHPETRPVAVTDAAGQLVQVVGTSRNTNGTGRTALTVTAWVSGSRYTFTADHGHGARDFARRADAVKWLKKVLTDESNDARFYE